ECVSPGELAHVRALFPDIDPDRLLFTPNFAPEAEYAEAFAAGAHVTLDNLYPLEAWPETFAGRAFFVRLDPGQGFGHHKYVRTAGTYAQFGVAPTDLDRLQALVETVDARIVGFHAHLGSGITGPDTWAETAVFLSGVAERFPAACILNLGGGLSVPERPEAQSLDVRAVAELLAQFKAAN